MSTRINNANICEGPINNLEVEEPTYDEIIKNMKHNILA
jgi:hypothetical protein